MTEDDWMPKEVKDAVIAWNLSFVVFALLVIIFLPIIKWITQYFS